MATSFAQAQPFDEHNQMLVSNVHPSGWMNPIPRGRYQMVVIGGGTAGLVTAAIAAGLGAKTALIERDLLGGDCLNVGCVPSKALIRCARAAAEVRRAHTFGVKIGGDIEVNFPAVMERMRKLRARISHHDSVKRFTEFGMDVYLGSGRFTSPTTIDVDGTTLEFARACIATGGRASVPAFDGLDDVGYLTNETIFSLTELPRRFAIIGGGPIGCEMAQCFARFGSEVHLIERSSHILPREDKDAAAIVRASLEHDGVHFHHNAQLARVETTSTGKRLTINCANDIEDTLEVDELLVAIGRAPNIESLGLDKAGVSFHKRGIDIDDRFRTSNHRIFAAGDCCSKYQFTHAADFMARAVVRNALFFGRAKHSRLVVPWCTYTEPEIAHVGLYPRELTEQGIDFETIHINLDTVDRAILEGADEGFLKVHRRKGKGDILGATLVAADAGDMIGEVSLAVTHGIGLGKFSTTIHPYPTVAEVLRTAGDEYNRTRLTPLAKKVMGMILKLTR